MGYNRGKGRLYSANGFYNLATLRAVITEELGSTNATVTMTDVRDVLLNVLDIIDNLEIPEPTPTGSVDYKYTAGNGGAGLTCQVTATSEDVTYAVASGVGTITVPADTQLKGFTVKGDTSILNSGTFRLRIVFEDATTLNNDEDDALLCVWQAVNASALDVGITSTALPQIIDNDNTPQKQFTTIAGNVIELSVPAINAFTQWFINGVMC